MGRKRQVNQRIKNQEARTNLEILAGRRPALVHLLEVRLLLFGVLPGTQDFLLLLVRLLLLVVGQEEAVKEPGRDHATAARRAN